LGEDTVEFRLLGPVEASIGERLIALGGAKPRTLIAALLIDHGRVVPTSRLIDAVWGADPPDTARAVIQTYVSTLRHSLARADATAQIVTRPPGYLLRIGSNDLDRDLFERLFVQGRKAAAAERYRDATELLRAASAQWRGPALGGVESEILSGEAARLDEMRLTAIEERIHADLALRRLDEAAAELTELVRRHPFRERMHGQLMVALSGMGRQSEALTVYRRLRSALVDEMGIEPGAALKAIHQSILRCESGPAVEPAAATTVNRAPPPALAAGLAPVALVEKPIADAMPTAGPSLAADPSLARPHQLPPVPADFTGRGSEIAALAAALTGGTPGETAGVQLIVGKGGTGKSALGARAAHEVAARFPDGQLYAELRGMSGTPAEPRDVLGRFLLALGMAPATVPGTLEERVERYRTLVAGRRMLVVLDDAGSEAQVRPMLPGSPACAVLVTSRTRLAGLAGANPTELDVMDADESIALLSRIIGADRTRAEPESARQITTLCGGLPLAIRVAGARLASRPRWPLRLLADRLADEHQRLDELAVGDQEVRASITLSYRSLDEQARAALRVLGVLGLPDFPSWIVAAALELSEIDGERVVERLVDAHLVDFVHVDGVGHLRYRLHDLVRLYARERADAEDTGPVRAEMVARVAGHWVALIDAIAARTPSGELQIRDGSESAGPALDRVAGRVLAHPKAWFDAEYESLVVAVELTASMALDQLSCDLASGLCNSEFALNNRFEAWTRTHDAALTAARRAGNRHGEAVLLSGFGQLRYAQDRYSDACEYLCQALEAFRQDKDRRGEATSLAGLGATCREQGHFAEALHFLSSAEAILRDLRDASAIGYVRRLAGSVHLERGDYPAAEAALEEALAGYRRASSRRGEALTLRTIAMYHRARGELVAALDAAMRALAGFQEVGDELLEAYGLRTVGKTLIRLGRTSEARPALERSLVTSQQLVDRWGEAATLRVLGELGLAAGEPAMAERCFAASIARWDELRLPLWRARTVYSLSCLHAARGDADLAAALRTDAMTVFERFGAREYTELSAL
jgi:DNA-binding SARP family transcriptional activator